MLDTHQRSHVDRHWHRPEARQRHHRSPPSHRPGRASHPRRAEVIWDHFGVARAVFQPIAQPMRRHSPSRACVGRRPIAEFELGKPVVSKNLNVAEKLES